MPTTTSTRCARVSGRGSVSSVPSVHRCLAHRVILAHLRATGRARPGAARRKVRPCANNPSSRPRRCSGCGSATRSAAGSASPATGTSRAPSSGPWPAPGCPVAYSSGFNPHPRISYAGASPTGAASEAEYLEVGLAQESDPAAVLAALDEALPVGLDVLEVVVSPGGSLAELLEGSVWRTRVPGLRPAAAADAVRPVPGRRGGARGADDEEGDADLRLPRGGRGPRRRDRKPGTSVRYSTWSCGTEPRL